MVIVDRWTIEVVPVYLCHTLLIQRRACLCHSTCGASQFLSPRNLQKLPADDFSTENGVPLTRKVT